MDEEVERHRLIRDSLELELQALRQRLASVENITENVDSGNSNVEHTEEHISRSVMLLSSLIWNISYLRLLSLGLKERKYSDVDSCIVGY